MYVQPLLAEDRPEVLHALIRDHALGSLIAVTPEGLEANHVPFELGCEGGREVLRGHISASNPLAAALAADQEVLVVFQGPNHYISPSWQPAAKTHGRVAPSWNYAVVHAYGRIRTIGDGAWLGEHLNRLIEAQEAGREEPWSLSAAPAEFIDALKRNIVGLEIEVTRLVGKWQACQQYGATARGGIVEGLMSEGTDLAAAVGAFIRERGPVSA